MLFLFLSASFINLAEAGDVSNQEKALYLADYECVADSTPEYDPDDGVGISYEVTEYFEVALTTLEVQTQATYHLNFTYLRPLTRAPPKVFN
ncbi:hypothetical protein [Paraglaciecola arctica]|uniref:Uncharacterized protein n=1 Tax=Paraglaciecola arctica BSs20135 TaxID=493475 RepID=K6YLZ5_9ALTE|nr:hypothetical protein [Paraglaciecola arctica]GAC17668.1 hypothetical protein GARC_0687 [Paraglaciecola arctica BSs20135]